MFVLFLKLKMPPKEGAHRIRQIKNVQAQFKMNVHVILTVMWMVATSAALTVVDDCAGRKLVGITRS